MEQNNNENNGRRHFTPEQKFKIVKEHFTQRTALSETLKKHDISSANFYRWQDEFFSGALERMKNGKQQVNSQEIRQIEDLNKQVNRYKNVIAEMSHEVVSLKKTLGE
jgi:transposase-like protein